MRKTSIAAFPLLQRVRERQPLVHHITNWVTIYDCAQVVKTLGASPVMAHAPEEVAEMTFIASALVLNIGTLTVDLVNAMKIAAQSANKKGIPVVLDVCGAGATRLRNDKCAELLSACSIDVIKGNASEVAQAAGHQGAVTKGVDAVDGGHDLMAIARVLAVQRNCTVVITGAEDIVSDGRKTYAVRNGHPLMTQVVGTGCMAASVIGTFCAVEKDLAKAAVAALVCYEIAAEQAAVKAKGPASFKEALFDYLHNMDQRTLARRQKVFA